MKGVTLPSQQAQFYWIDLSSSRLPENTSRARKNDPIQNIYFQMPLLLDFSVSHCVYCCHMTLFCVHFLIWGLWLGLHRFRSNGSSEDEYHRIDIRMIYSTVVTGGVLRLCHPGRCLPSHLICIYSISVPTMTHTTNEAPTGQGSVQLTVTLVFYPSLQTCTAPRQNLHMHGSCVKIHDSC